MDAFDDTFQHQILPKSLGRPLRDKKAYREYVISILPFFKSLDVRLSALILNEDED